MQAAEDSNLIITKFKNKNNNKTKGHKQFGLCPINLCKSGLGSRLISLVQNRYCDIQ